MLEHEKYFPDWLFEAIVEDFLPWDQAKDYSFERFAEKYTLHDSIWVGLFANVSYEDSATLAIMWDAVWLPDEIAKSTSNVMEYPFLFIKVENVNQILTKNYKNIGSIQRGISGAEFYAKEDGRKHLIIIDHYNGRVEIVFNGSIKFLGLDREKQILQI